MRPSRLCGLVEIGNSL